MFVDITNLLKNGFLKARLLLDSLHVEKSGIIGMTNE